MPPDSFLVHHPLGKCLPGSLHSVVCSLPTMADVYGYEEKKPEILEKLTTGYPRFLPHPLIRRVQAAIAQEKGLQPNGIALVCSEKSGKELLQFAGGLGGFIEKNTFFTIVRLPAEQEAKDRARLFLQHTGTSIGSREAEDWLVHKGLVTAAESEGLTDCDAATASLRVREQLHEIYGTSSPNDIFLTRGGMNAFYAAYRATNALQAPKGRHLWIQLGWLYLDTMRILEKFHSPGHPPIQIYNVFDFAALERLLQERGHEVAGIVTEIPTNPLVQTCDLARLETLARAHGAYLLLDPTIASPCNVNVLSKCDLHINSLTKYAGHKADTMLGALAVNPNSPHAEQLRPLLSAFVEAPYDRDTRRLAHQIGDYKSTVQKINENTRAVASWLRQQPKVDSLYWTFSADTRKNYEAIATGLAGPGSIITFTVHGELKRFYDNLRMPKGPSFGVDFTLCCPFMYMAHFDLVTTPEGRAYLNGLGIPPDLIRLSVGTEPVEEIIAVLKEALDCLP